MGCRPIFLGCALSSKVRATIEEIEAGARSSRQKMTPVPKMDTIAALALALNGGDDYELLFTVARAKARKIPSTTIAK